MRKEGKKRLSCLRKLHVVFCGMVGTGGLSWVIGMKKSRTIQSGEIMGTRFKEGKVEPEGTGVGRIHWWSSG